MAKVTIVIPVYNSAKYLRQCLDSIISQSIKDIEIICVNDGSKDKSLKILQEYASKDSRITIINKVNEGQGVARNIAIAEAEGEYLLFVDSDDWLEENALELAYNKIRKDQVDILFFDCYRFSEKLQKKYLFRFTNTFQNFKEKPFIKEEASKILFMTNALTFKMYKTDFIQENNIQFSNHKFMEDMTFFVKAILLAKYISCLEKPLYNYRIYKKSSTFNYKECLKSIEEVYNQCFSIVRKYNNNEQIWDSFLESRKKGLLAFYMNIPFFKKRKYYEIMQKIIKDNFPKAKLDSDLINILGMNYLQWLIYSKKRITKIVLSTYSI